MEGVDIHLRQIVIVIIVVVEVGVGCPGAQIFVVCISLVTLCALLYGRMHLICF